MTSPSAAGAIANANIIAVACSGGSDSAAALLETRRLAPRADVIACYVDHGVRPRASIERDINAVRVQARAVGARTLVARLSWADPTDGSSEATLRKARYHALSEMAKHTGASLMVTGHHAGDVAEWVLIAMLRGSGVDGLAAMAEIRPMTRGVRLVRPLLRDLKSTLANEVRELHLPVSVDETNANPRYARNLVRAFLSAWSERGAAPEKTLARSAALLAEDRAALDVLVRSELDRARSRSAHRALEVRSLWAISPPVLRRVVRMIVRETAGAATDFSLAQCEAIVQAIRARSGGEFQAGNATVILSAGLLRITTRSSASVARPIGELRSPYYMGNGAHSYTVRLRAEALSQTSNLTVRLSAPGDTCVPSGRRSPISLARFLAKEGVPRDLRASVPLLCVNGRIAAALGVRVMEPFAPVPGEATVDVTWRPGALSGRADMTDTINMKLTSS